MRTLVLLLFLGFAGPALAHHPGSHATREADGRVRVEAVTVANDRCTALSPVTAGAPDIEAQNPWLERPERVVQVLAVVALLAYRLGRLAGRRSGRREARRWIMTTPLG